MAKENRGIDAELQEVTVVLKQRIQEGSVILLLALSALLCVALNSYHPADLCWSHTPQTAVVHNTIGQTGAYVADLLFYWFGYIAYIFPLMLAYSSVRIFYKGFLAGPLHRLLWGLRVSGFFLALMAGCGLGNLHFLHWKTALPNQIGGVLGHFISHQAIIAFGEIGASLVLLASILTGMTLATGLSWFGLMDTLGRTFFEGMVLLPGRLSRLFRKKEAMDASPLALNPKITIKKITPSFDLPDQTSASQMALLPTLSGKPGKKPLLSETASSAMGLLRKPCLSLLEKETIQDASVKVSKEALEALSREVEARLLEFGVQGRVGAPVL